MLTFPIGVIGNRVDHVESHHSLSSAPRRSVRRMAVALVVVLVAGAAATYQIGIRAKRPPRFRRGGAFVHDASSGGSGALGPMTANAPSTGDAAASSTTVLVAAGGPASAPATTAAV